MSLADK